LFSSQAVSSVLTEFLFLRI